MRLREGVVREVQPAVRGTRDLPVSAPTPVLLQGSLINRSTCLSKLDPVVTASKPCPEGEAGLMTIFG